eukprot:2107610-Pleurochrysis_carterae.AAC.1
MAEDECVRGEVKTQLTFRSNRFSVRTQWRSRFRSRMKTEFKSTPHQCLNVEFASIRCASYALNVVEV